jgi:HD superfamily phosphohydrolase
MENNSSTGKLKSKVEDFTSKFLERPFVPPTSKVIHDALWGTQLLQRHEVAFLNSPLIQRLRRLHQTGFSYLTYPSTTHTRFEHSLGVMYQTERLAKSLYEKYQGTEQDTDITREIISKLRLAALLHDCSHGPFSHTSEEVYRFLPDMQPLVEPGGEFASSSPSEVLAHFILTSESFKFFLNKIREEVALDVDPRWLSDVILGTRLDPLAGHQTDVINGPFDADKLDYIFRDGHYSGLPLGIDLDRLWYSTEIHVIRPGQLQGVAKPMRRLVMARSGVNSLEQIVACRMNLTSSLYHHHKVRACDCMFKAVLTYCIENGVELCGRKIESAADFLFMTDIDVLGEAGRNADGTVRELIGNIVNRNLYKRALVISMNTFDRPDSETSPKEETKHLNLVQKLAFTTQDAEGSKKYRGLAEQIWELAGKPGRKEEVWLDFPRKPKLEDLSKTFVNIGRQNDPDFKVLSEFIPMEQWAKQYVLNKWRGHVFCKPEYVEKISRAALEVLSTEFKVIFNPYARTLCNLSTIAS